MVWLLIWLIIKKLNPIVTDVIIRGRKLNTFIVLLHIHISKYLKKLDWKLHICLLWKFQTKENFNKLH